MSSTWRLSAAVTKQETGQSFFTKRFPFTPLLFKLFYFYLTYRFWRGQIKGVIRYEKSVFFFSKLETNKQKTTKKNPNWNQIFALFCCNFLQYIILDLKDIQLNIFFFRLKIKLLVPKVANMISMNSSNPTTLLSSCVRLNVLNFIILKSW